MAKRELGCYNDIACYSNWVNSGLGIGLMSFVKNGGSYVCTGSMLNNTSSDFTPYFMTAHHCMEDNGGALNSLQVYWFYEEATCNGAVPSLGSVPRSSVSTYVRSNLGTDMSLVMIEGAVPRNLWWAGNDPNAVADGTYVIGIHHPAGTRKRVSFGNKSGGNGCSAAGLVDGFNVDYYSGTVEPGSSGSPLLLSNGAFVGAVVRPGAGTLPEARATRLSTAPGPVGYPAFATYVNNPGSDDGYENNDSCGSATNLNIYSNGTLYSLIVKSTHPDWFHISVPAFGDASFHTHFTSANGDIDMQLHDGCGAVLATSDGTADDETIAWHNSASVPKEVYLNVYLYNDTRNIYYLDFARYNAVAPFNDSCSNAADLTLDTPGVPLNGTVYGSTIGATADGGANCTTTTGTADVWHRLWVPCTRTVSLDTAGSDYDTVLSVHTGCPGTAANQVACNDDVFPGTLWSSLTFTPTGGQYYYVRVSGYNTAAGHYQLNWHQTNASNDLCAQLHRPQPRHLRLQQLHLRHRRPPRR